VDVFWTNGEKGSDEAKGTVGLKGPIKAKEPTTVIWGPQRESSSFSATPEWL